MNNTELKIAIKEISVLFDKLSSANSTESRIIMDRISKINKEIDMEIIKQKAEYLSEEVQTIKIDGSGLDKKLAKFMCEILDDMRG